MMNADNRDERLIRRVKTDLDRSVEALDRDTLRRLRAIRQAALRRDETPAARGWWVPAGAFVSVLLVGWLSLSLWLEKPSPQVADVLELEDVEVLSTADDIEFFDELEFYQWLNTDAQAG
jgi:type VI protein secretion system component VasF